MGSDARIAVVGSYAVGLTMRTARAPSSGETVEGSDFSELHGGKGSNQAVACARLGACVSFLVCIGSDSAGDAAMKLYEAEGVDTAAIIRHPTLPTGVGFIIVEDSGENLIAVDFGANRALLPSNVEEHREMIGRAKVVIAQLEIPPETVAAAMWIGREEGVISILNPAPYREIGDEVWRSIDVITPNESEARLIVGLAPGDNASHEELADGIIEKGVGAVVLTLGGAGAYVQIPGFTGVVPGRKVDAVDTTGAGDAFAAAIATALAEANDGLSCLREAVEFAVVAGSLAVTKYGVIPALPYRSEIDPVL